MSKNVSNKPASKSKGTNDGRVRSAIRRKSESAQASRRSAKRGVVTRSVETPPKRGTLRAVEVERVVKKIISTRGSLDDQTRSTSG